MNWYEAKDGQRSFGLIRNTGVAKAGLTAYANMTAKLGTRPIWGNKQ